MYAGEARQGQVRSLGKTASMCRDATLWPKRTGYVCVAFNLTLPVLSCRSTVTPTRHVCMAQSKCKATSEAEPTTHGACPSCQCASPQLATSQASSGSSALSKQAKVFAKQQISTCCPTHSPAEAATWFSLPLSTSRRALEVVASALSVCSQQLIDGKLD